MSPPTNSPPPTRYASARPASAPRPSPGPGPVRPAPPLTRFGPPHPAQQSAPIGLSSHPARPAPPPTRYDAARPASAPRPSPAPRPAQPAPRRAAAVVASSDELPPAARQAAALVPRSPPAPLVAAPRGSAIQGLILYTDAVFRGAARKLANSHFGRRIEDSAPWARVTDLRTNKDWRLTLLGHADGDTFGGLTAQELVNGLLERRFLESHHQILELIGCAAAATPSRGIDTFVDQVRGLLRKTFKAFKVEKPLSVRGLRQPETGQDSIFLTTGNGQFVYITGRRKDIERAASFSDILKYDQLIDWLRQRNIRYETDKFKNIRQYLSEPERKTTHKHGIDHPLFEFLLPSYAK